VRSIFHPFAGAVCGDCLDDGLASTRRVRRFQGDPRLMAFTVKDSGKRAEFSSGSVRDTDDGKPSGGGSRTAR